MAHIPVLLQECLKMLSPQPGEIFTDGTLGATGHAKEIRARITPGGTLLGVDRDSRAIEDARTSLSRDASVKVVLEAASYARIPELMKKHGIEKLDGLLVDLGFSSEQIIGGTLAGRGFSFMTDEPLLMTYDNETAPLAQRLAELTESQLALIIREHGEERYAAQIANRIIAVTRSEGIATSGRLASVIASAVPKNYERGRIHPATRTFQALRIFVNNELGELQSLLASLPMIMAPGGRVAIISFHSLEDRIIKHSFYALTGHSGGRSANDRPRAYQPGEAPNSTAASSAQLITKKPVTASAHEIAANPRSRSAKLRAIQFL